MTSKIIVDDSRAGSQGHTEAGSPTDGLRLLARMIACDLMARQSGYGNSKKYQNATSLESETNTQVKKVKQDA